MHRQVCELLPQLMSDDPQSEGGKAFPDSIEADRALYHDLLTEKVGCQLVTSPCFTPAYLLGKREGFCAPLHADIAIHMH